MDGEPQPEREITRVPTDADLVSLARELKRLGVASGVVGGFAINRLGFVRATADIDLLIARDLANQTLVTRVGNPPRPCPPRIGRRRQRAVGRRPGQRRHHHRPDDRSVRRSL